MPLPPELYDRRYFLSNFCEGAEEFLADRGLSALKAAQLEALDPQPGMRVLDAGCGRGEVLLACARRGAAVVGIDYSEAAVELSRETLAGVPGAEVVSGSVEALPWPDASFDRALFGDVIEHLDPAQAKRALSELHRVLRPGGLLLIHTSPNRLFLSLTWPVARRFLRALGHAANVERTDGWIADSKRYHVNEQTPRRLRRSLRGAGFEDPEVWLDPNVLRGGEHHLTEGLEHSPLFRSIARLAAMRPLRLLFSNDLFALARR
jgi:ubiquinone/menaquinone biosynthesis C-methylase UbiE